MGGVEINEAGAAAMINHPELVRAVDEARKHNQGVTVKGAKRRNVLVVVLESTTGTLVTPSNPALVSPWMKALSSR